MEEEIWREIKGWESLYEISSLGRVKSLPNGKWRKRERILKACITNNYLSVALSRNGKSKTYNVHRLVATTFIKPESQGLQVDHINGVKTDNRVKNLRWVTSKQNNNNPNTLQHLQEKRSRCIERVYVDGRIEEYRIMQDAVDEGLSRNRIIDCCNGRLSIYKECIWRYKGTNNKDNINIIEEIRKRKASRKKKISKAIKRIGIDDKIVIYDSIRDVIRDGFNTTKVIDCCKNRIKEYKGYRWEYIK